MVSRSFDEMNRMFEQMDRMLDGMWTRFSDRETARPWARADVAYDLHEAEDGAGYVLVVDLPGFEKDELDVRAVESALLVDASHDTESERSFQRRSVSERFSIPVDVDVENVRASYHNGVLEVTLPVSGEIESGHRIDVE